MWNVAFDNWVTHGIAAMVINVLIKLFKDI